jgi:hypothetical protein
MKKVCHGYVRFEVFMAVTMKNAIFLDVTPCGSCKNPHFGGMLVLTRATWCHIPEDGILLSELDEATEEAIQLVLNAKSQFMNMSL